MLLLQIRQFLPILNLLFNWKLKSGLCSSMTLPERIKAASNVPHFISVVVNNRFCGFDAAIFFFDLKVMGACAAQWNDALQVCLVDAPPVVRNSRLNEPSGFESDVGRCHRPGRYCSTYGRCCLQAVRCPSHACEW